jgi:hypothetical protein
MDIGMPRWRNGRGRTPAPMVHLSADRLGDMVDAVRSNPPDLATLPRTQAAFLEAPPVEFSPAPPLPSYEASSDSSVESPAEVAPDYTWDDAVPPAALTAEDIAAIRLERPLRDFEIPEVPELASASRVAKKKGAKSKTKGGRHRQPPSLKHFGRGLGRSMRAALFTPRVVALLGIVGLLVVATALLGMP